MQKMLREIGSSDGPGEVILTSVWIAVVWVQVTSSDLLSSLASPPLPSPSPFDTLYLSLVSSFPTSLPPDCQRPSFQNSSLMTYLDLEVELGSALTALWVSLLLRVPLQRNPRRALTSSCHSGVCLLCHFTKCCQSKKLFVQEMCLYNGCIIKTFLLKLVPSQKNGADILF